MAFDIVQAALSRESLCYSMFKYRYRIEDSLKRWFVVQVIRAPWERLDNGHYDGERTARSSFVWLE